MNNDSGYGIWYLLILFFVIMICIPPLFRILIPQEKTVSNALKTLECKKTEALTQDLEAANINYEIKTLYSNEKISAITFKYSIQNSNSEDFNNIDQTKIDNDFFYELINLKNVKNAVVDEAGNVTTMTFNFLSNDFTNEPMLQKYTQNINNQKKEYENKNFVCSIN